MSTNQSYPPRNEVYRGHDLPSSAARLRNEGPELSSLDTLVVTVMTSQGSEILWCVNTARCRTLITRSAMATPWSPKGTQNIRRVKPAGWHARYGAALCLRLAARRLRASLRIVVHAELANTLLERLRDGTILGTICFEAKLFPLQLE